MMQTKIFFLIFLGCSIFITANAAKSLLLNKPECTQKRLREVDRNFMKLIVIGENGRKFPESYDELPKFCKDTDRLIDSMLKFINECYSPDEQRIFKIYFFSAKRVVKTLCMKKRTKKLQHLLETTPCVNTIVDKIDCVDRITNQTLQLIPYNIGATKINYACCYYVDALKCAEEQLSVPCMTNKGKEILMDMIRSIAGDMVNFACGDYTESTDRCDHIAPLPKNKLDKSYKFTKFRSIVLAQIGLIESIGGFAAQP
ncbi:uncharacterized protein LOC113790257 [Dermatophagoides pteronyssinus]|uniref:uncharacterized protein LOC113790257 n=1 Tax=Dermatophagoides pteronyssinus TaxID=6956 RepID=UPI003F669C87